MNYELVTMNYETMNYETMNFKLADVLLVSENVSFKTNGLLNNNT